MKDGWGVSWLILRVSLQPVHVPLPPPRLSTQLFTVLPQHSPAAVVCEFLGSGQGFG